MRAGETLPGGFELRRKLGAGGFGAVWEAWDTNLDRAVAVKVLHGNLAEDEKVVQRFLREARLTAGIRHPNLVELHSVGQDEAGLPFLVMELLEGETLESRLQREGRLSPEDAVDLLVPVLRGLESAHRKGFVHRDFKPANVFLPVDDMGRPYGAKVLDFGIAKAMAGSTASMTKGAIGTLPIMAPEQFSPSDPAARIDVYAAGVVLYRMLSGRWPISHEDPAVAMRAILLGEWRPLSEVAPEVPAEVVRLVEGAMAASPAARPADAGGLADALEAWREKTRSAMSVAPPVALEPVLPDGGAPPPPVGVGPTKPPAPTTPPTPPVAPTEALGPSETPPAVRPTDVLRDPQPMDAEGGETPGRSSGMPGWALPALGAGGLLAVVVVVGIVASRGGGEGEAVAGEAVVACPEGMVAIPGGTFQMGSPEGEGWNDERPQHEVTLSGFCLDRTEVTVSAYAACVDAGDCRAPGIEYSECNWGRRSSRGDHPVNCVSWDDARSYCGWRGGSLPTEAQWEYAARGTDGRTYPWGNPEPTERRLQSSVHCGSLGCAGGTAAVGTHPSGASPFGVEDMAGNVWEWVADWDGAYPSTPQTDPSGPSAGRRRVFRGGNWGHFQPSNVRAAARVSLTPSLRNDFVGFRCSRGG